MPVNVMAKKSGLDMSGQQYQDEEDFIFNDQDDETGTQVAVREPGQTPAAPEPRQTERSPVPANPAPSTRDVTVDDGDDHALVSDAINQLLRPTAQPRQQVQVRETAPAPAQTQQQAPAERQQPGGQDQRQPPLTPREQAFLRDLQEERRQRQELQARLNGGNQQQTQQPQQDFETRFFENPQEIINGLQQSWGQQLATLRLEQDLSLAEIRHGSENFGKAFQDYMDAVGTGNNPALYQRVMTSDSPGEEIVRWHREHTLLQETGGDLQAFEQRIREKILAELNGGQQQAGVTQEPSARQTAAQDAPRRDNGQFAPRHEVRLPTATSRLAGTAGNSGNEELEDGSDDAIFDAGRAPRSRR